jgi:hypothetical protein
VACDGRALSLSVPQTLVIQLLANVGVEFSAASAAVSQWHHVCSTPLTACVGGRHSGVGDGGVPPLLRRDGDGWPLLCGPDSGTEWPTAVCDDVDGAAQAIVRALRVAEVLLRVRHQVLMA